MRASAYLPEKDAHYAFGTGYATWSLFLNLHPAARVLVVGGDPLLCEQQLGARCAEVLVLGSETVRDNNANGAVLAAPLSSLPLADGSLDCVFLPAAYPGALEDASLKEVARCLKPGGQVFVAAENTLNLEGSSLTTPGGDAPLTRLISNYRNPGIRSARSCIAKLKRLGLGDSRLYGVTGQVTMGQEIIPYGENVQPLKGALDWRQRLKRRPLLVPSFGLLAGRNSVPDESFFKRILTPAIAQSLGETGGFLQVDTWEVTGKQKLMLHARYNDTPVMARFTFDDESSAAERNSYAMLQRLAQAHPEVQVLPRPVACGPQEGQDFFVETRLPGKPLRRRVLGGQREGAVAMAIDVLCRLNTPEDLGSVVFDGELYERLVLERLRKLEPFIDDATQRKQLAELFEQHLRGREISQGLSHGDFSTSNILVDDRGQLSAVVDWETGCAEGFPALDGLGILISVDVTSGSESSIAERYALLADGHWSHEQEYAQLLGLYSHLGVAADLHTGLVLLYWLHTVILRLRYDMRKHPLAISVHITEVVDAFLGARQRPRENG